VQFRQASPARAEPESESSESSEEQQPIEELEQTGEVQPIEEPPPGGTPDVEGITEQPVTALPGAVKPGRWSLSQLYAAADIIALAIDLGTGTGINKSFHTFTGSQGLQGVGRTLKAALVGNGDKIEVRVNPWLVYDGHGQGDSPLTQTYLRNRYWKEGLGVGMGAAGNAIGWTVGHGVNPLSAIQHLSSSVSNAGHIYKIRQIAAAHRGTAEVARWCSAILKMKTYKSGTRLLQLSARVVPVPIASQTINIAAIAASVGHRIGYAELCYVTALEIHRRAFHEQRARNQPERAAAIGPEPASEIMREIFEQRTLTRLIHLIPHVNRYQVEALIREPAGWMALADKLMLS
jgi:hypothetical protein